MKVSKESLKYILFGISCLLIFAVGELARVFEPLYSNIYYGTLNTLFYDVIKAVICIIGIVVVSFLSRKF